ncbi:hypothetical protein EDB85DRAFT_1985959 [Lactarius pseudohatsudake]|nr:hypothetical protein EDB85DRAFT_1985959 [Lactarius pseudohatsudake]
MSMSLPKPSPRQVFYHKLTSRRHGLAAGHRRRGVTAWCRCRGVTARHRCCGLAPLRIIAAAFHTHCVGMPYYSSGLQIGVHARQVLLQFAWTELAEDGAFHDNEQCPFNAMVMMPSPPSGNGDHFLRATTAAQIPAHDTSMCSLTHREGEGEFVLCTAGGSLRPSLLKYAGIARGSPFIIVFRNTHNRPNPFCSKNKPGF